MSSQLSIKASLTHKLMYREYYHRSLSSNHHMSAPLSQPQDEHEFLLSQAISDCAHISFVCSFIKFINRNM